MKRQIFTLIALVSLSCVMTAQANFNKVMITEVRPMVPFMVEVHNFSNSSVDMSNWVLSAFQAGTYYDSYPLGITIMPGETILVSEGTPVNPAAGFGITMVQGWHGTWSIGLSINRLAMHAVLLKDAGGNTRDVVQVSNSSGFYTYIPLPGFVGHADRGIDGPVTDDQSVERIWGLDSDSGRDWTEATTHSLGLENRNSGTRGESPNPAPPAVKISEVASGSPDLIELSYSGSQIDLMDWFLLVSVDNGAPIIKYTPFSTSTPIGLPGKQYVVIGDGAIPAELPASVPYRAAGANLPMGGQEYTIGLYNADGECVDVLRTTRLNSELVHNFPRLPAHHSVFNGGARRLSGLGYYIARFNNAPDGSAWRPAAARTMGLSNGSLLGIEGHGDTFDVRANATTNPDGSYHCVIQGKPNQAGYIYSLAFSPTITSGFGPFMGLAGDSLGYFMVFYGIAPFTGNLDSQGSARFDFPPGFLPAGFSMELVYFLQNPANGELVGNTLVIPYDN